MKRLIYDVLLLCFLAVSQTTFADKYKIVCVYETPTKGNQEIYNTVLEGIKSKAGDIQTLLIPDNTESLKQQIDQAGPDKIIALGRSPAETVAALAYRDKTVAGLFPFNASSFNGVSLVLSDKSLAAKLTQFIPNIRRIFFIQEQGFKTIETNKGVNIPGLKIIAIDGNDSLSTSRELGRIVENEATPYDAVFLPANLSDEILFNLALTAWEKNVKLFSTNIGHLENGALMAFYPSPRALGEQIGELAKKNYIGYETAAKIDVALNRRIAQHLGVKFTPDVEALFSVKIK